MGLRLTIIETSSGHRTEHLLSFFPVRIGRNPLNDVRIDESFVSQFHAVIEQDASGFLLRDLGSRNGSLASGAPVDPQTPTPLLPHGNQFSIVGLQLYLETADVPVAKSEARRRLEALGNATMAKTAAVGAGDAVLVGRLLVDIKPAIDAWRGAFAHILAGLAPRLAGAAPHVQAQILEALAHSEPAFTREPEFQRLAASLGEFAPKFVSDDAVIAQAIRDMATTYVPDASKPLRTAEQTFTFLGKLQDTLDVFLKSFIALREGHQEFESKMKTGRNTTRGDLFRLSQSVKSAKDPRVLAARLLDWSDNSAEGPRLVESVFADVMIHQVAVLGGVMRGVKSLLKELSPPALEATLEKKKPSGIAWGPWRFARLWERYRERHSDLADEDTATFELIFGSEFVKAYTRLADAPAAKTNA